MSDWRAPAGAIVAVGLLGTLSWALFRTPAPAPPVVEATPLKRSSHGWDEKILQTRSKGQIHRIAPSPTGPVPAGQRLLLVTWDTVRADHTTPYGYGRDTTPVLADLAAQGVVFEQFWVPQATTLPTHVSWFTGVHPDEHGVIGNVAESGRRFVPPASLPTLAQDLSGAGYLTAAVVSSTPMKRYSGISEGFQEWSQPVGKSRKAGQSAQLAVQWLNDAPADRPFLLWVHLYDPHAPYEAIPRFAGLTADDPRPQLEAWGIPVTEEHVDWNNHYDQEIHLLDNQLGRLLTAGERFDDLVVVVAGDHGEGLGQHGHKEHGLTWPEQLQAPLVVRAPGLEPRRVSTLTSASDLLPLLAAIGDFPTEDAWLARTSGVDPLNAPADRGLLQRSSLRQLKDLHSGGGQKTLTWSWTTPEWFLIHHSDAAAQLFDRRADPQSKKDVAAEHPEVVARLQADLLQRRDAYHKRAETLGSGKTEALAADTLSDLEALGYVE